MAQGLSNCELKVVSYLIPVIFVLSAGCAGNLSRSNASGICWHEDFYYHLNSHLVDPRDPMQVFDHVFGSLREDANIYPSENYYYFTLAASGRLLRGSFSLQAATRDQGLIHFDYDEAGGVDDDPSPLGHHLKLGPRDGVIVKKLSDNRYAVSYKGKRVLFTLRSRNDTSLSGMTLFEHESILFNANDESGLDFQLIYDRSTGHAYWVLNQRTYGNETFKTVQGDFVVGRRTQFAFYRMDSQKKMVLVGVLKANVSRNEWYDGPFDQLADNAAYRGEINLKAFYLKALPKLKAELVDDYGFFEDGGRIAITPYRHYENLTELGLAIRECERKWRQKNERFIQCITPAP